MINSGICPKCGKIISAVKIEDVDVRVGFQSKWRGISYCCLHCNTVLNVEIDPIAIKTDIVNEITKSKKTL